MRTISTVLLVFLLLAGCASDPEKKQEPEQPVDPTTGKPVTNLLAENERSQLYFDIDQYTTRYMTARSEGKARAWTSLHASVLMPMVDRNIDELIHTLNSKEEPRYRMIAARGLGFGSKTEQIVPHLVAVLSEENPILVSSALVSLYLLGSADTPLAPLNQLLSHPDPIVRSNDALALYSVFRARRKAKRSRLTQEVREASGRLMSMATSPDEDTFVRGHAAAAIGAIGDPSGADVLINLLLDEEPMVRVKAAQGLATIGRESAIQPLIKGMELAESSNEAEIIAASIDKIARTLNYPCDLEALGTDFKNWLSWYDAVKSEE